MLIWWASFVILENILRNILSDFVCGSVWDPQLHLSLFYIAPCVVAQYCNRDCFGSWVVLVEWRIGRCLWQIQPCLIYAPLDPPPRGHILTGHMCAIMLVLTGYKKYWYMPPGHLFIGHIYLQMLVYATERDKYQKIQQLTFPLCNVNVLRIRTPPITSLSKIEFVVLKKTQLLCSTFSVRYMHKRSKPKCSFG